MENEEADENERCRVITEVAVEQAMDKCGSREAVKEQLARMVGLDDDQPDPDCDAALERGLDESTLNSNRGLRQWVMCRAWKYVNEDEKTFSSAISKAWAEARAAGDELDVEV